MISDKTILMFLILIFVLYLERRLYGFKCFNKLIKFLKGEIKC